MIQPYPTSPDCSCTGLADNAHYHLDQIDDCVVVTAGGRIDAASLPDLLEAIDVSAAVGRRIVIDLTRVTFLDASTLDSLNAALTWVRDAKKSVAVVGPAGIVQTALQGAQDGTFSVPDHVDDAEVALTHPAAYLP